MNYLATIEYTSSRDQFFERFQELCKEAFVIKKNEFHMVIPGGTSPAYVLSKFQHMALPWHTVTLYQSDERITQNREDLNQTMQLRALGKELLSYIQRLVLFDIELDEKEMQKAFAQFLPSQFDLVILGAGADGHVAGLFDTQYTNSPIVFTHQTSTKINKRVSLSISRLLHSRSVIILMHGKEKQSILEHPQGTVLELFLKEKHVTVLWSPDIGI